MTVRWGVAGPGGIATRFAEDLRLVDGGEIVAVASRDLARADAFGERFGIPRRHETYEALAADADVDVVYVATPHSRHEQDTRLFVDAGKHVLCEKPFALNAAQATRMVDAARARGVFLMEAMWSRFLPSYRVLVELVGEAKVGELQLVEADFGFRAPVQPDHRLFARELGGGALLDLGVYPVQLCSLLLGTPDGVAAQGVIGSTGVDEHVAAVLHHATGALGVVQAAVRVSMPCSARITGTDGVIELPPFAHCPRSLRVTSAAGIEEIDAGFEGDGIRFQVEEVHRAVAAGLVESAVMPWAETVSIMETLDAIRAQVGVTYPGERDPGT